MDASDALQVAGRSQLQPQWRASRPPEQGVLHERRSSPSFGRAPACSASTLAHVLRACPPCFPAQVHSLPGLELLSRKQLEDSRVLGFRWPCAAAADSPAGSGASAGAMCCSLDGQLVLAGPGNEIARLAIVEDCVLPAPPASVYSMKLAQQAAAAAARRPRGIGAGGLAPRIEVPGGGPAEAEGGFSPLGVAAAAGKGFGQLLGHAATTVTGLAVSAADSLSQVGDRLEAMGCRVSRLQGPQADWVNCWVNLLQAGIGVACFMLCAPVL